MPRWQEIVNEVSMTTSNDKETAEDIVRRSYLKKLFELTGRNVISYYSGWLHLSKPSTETMIDDLDIINFEIVSSDLNKNNGLDIILHTHGGDLSVVEFIIGYLQDAFNHNVRSIVPQLAMSAGSILALSCNEVVMGNQSSLGPINPHAKGISCKAIVDEFSRAKREIKKNPESIEVWRTLLSKYKPGFIEDCRGALSMSDDILKYWLTKNMCKDDPVTKKKILNYFSDHKSFKTHHKHISKSSCKNIGVRILDMENDSQMYDIIMSIHYCYVLTFIRTHSLKIIENHRGVGVVKK